MYLALALALLVVLLRLLKSIPTAKISEKLWVLYTSHSPSATVRNFRAKRDELNEVRRERAATSSQDEFAKWARLDRRHQQLKKEYDVMQASVGADRQRFNTKVRTIKWISTTGVRWCVHWYFRKSPVAWVPRQALPWIGEYLLAFPSAPQGSISFSVWLFATDTTTDMAIKLAKRFMQS